MKKISGLKISKKTLSSLNEFEMSSVKGGTTYCVTNVNCGTPVYTVDGSQTCVSCGQTSTSYGACSTTGCGGQTTASACASVSGYNCH